MIIRVTLMVLFGWSLFAPFSAIGEQWPQWRGIANDAISLGSNLPLHWSENESIVWRTPLPGQGGATPVLWDDRIYLTSADGDSLVALCISATDGSIVWKRQVSQGNRDARAGEGNSASASPCTDGEQLWVFFSNGALACLDCETGNSVWSMDIGKEFGKLDIQFGLTSTPALEGDGLYLQLIHGPMIRGNSERTGKVVKLDKRTGRTIWAVDRKTDAEFECKHSYASPFVYQDARQRFLVVHGADCTTGHSLEEGHEIWRLDHLNGTTAINPKSFDATFRFVASPASVPVSIIVPTAKEGPTVCIDATQTLQGQLVDQPSAIRWVFPKTPDVSIPLIVDQQVYLLHKDGKLHCLDLSTGREHYLERTHTSQHRASPIFADGHVLLCSREGITSIVKTGTTFQMIAQNDLKESLTASPVFANGTLYLRTYDALYAIRR